MPDAITLTTGPLNLEQVEQVARGRAAVALSSAAQAALTESHERLQAALATGLPFYGVNTGFGSLSSHRIERDRLEEVQHNLIRSHAAGAGPPLPQETVRSMLLLLAASLARGRSGVRPVVVEMLIELLNHNILPIVPSIGSVGASGDLAPLAHAALLLIGEGEAMVDGRRGSGAAALKQAGLTPLRLGPKEGLALINGTHLMAGQGALLCRDVDRLLDAAIAATAMSIDACRATDAFLDPRVYEVRHQAGPALIAERLLHFLEGSEIVPSHRVDDPRVQDPYSFRCTAIVLGAAVDAVEYVTAAIEAELGAVTDNPLIFPGSGGEPAWESCEEIGSRTKKAGRDDRSGAREAHPADVSFDIVSAGNFHGMPIALPLDVLAIALAHIAGIAERRVFFMLAASDPEAHLTPHLSPSPGVQSGLMITQYTAAACCNELIGLANPASVANLPTCAGMEDYNSFGPRSAAKAGRAVELCEHVIAIELLCAAAALQFQRPLRSGQLVEQAYAAIRGAVPDLTADRPPAPDIVAIGELIRAGAFDFSSNLPPQDGDA